LATPLDVRSSRDISSSLGVSIALAVSTTIRPAADPVLPSGRRKCTIEIRWLASVSIR
jgi:hypothetical protein